MTQPVDSPSLALARRVLRIEAAAISALAERLGTEFERALDLISFGKVDLKPLITGTYRFDQSVAVFERAARGPAEDVKLQIVLGGEE